MFAKGITLALCFALQQFRRKHIPFVTCPSQKTFALAKKP
jgi:hypothetical protein